MAYIKSTIGKSDALLTRLFTGNGTGDKGYIMIKGFTSYLKDDPLLRTLPKYFNMMTEQPSI